MEKEEMLQFLYRRYGAGDGKEIHPIELAYFVKKGIVPGDVEVLLRQAEERDPLAREKFALYSFLRQRGYISRILEGPFLLGYRKGYRPGEDRSTYLIKVVSEENTGALLEDLKKATEMRKELVYAVKTKEGYRFIKLTNTHFE